MKTTIFLAHPNLDASRVNSSLARAATQVDGVGIRHLYALYPDGTIDVVAEQKAAMEADRIVWQFPMYWFSIPPLLKAWMDDVLTYGWAYGTNGTALQGKELLIAVSTGARAEQYRHDEGARFTVNELLAPLRATSNLIGTRLLNPFVTCGALSITDEELLVATQAYAAAVADPRREVLE